jgi:sugar lactone lactonase YvrE
MMNPKGPFRRLAGTGLGVLLWLAVLPLASLGQANYATPYTFITLAGSAGYGCADGTNSAAQFAYPSSVAVDSAGNLYVADTVNCTIREMTPVGTNWVVTTLAGQVGCTGTNDGTGNAARFYYPNGVAVDNAGNVYVADTVNHTIRKVTPVGTNWVVTTLVGQAGSAGANDGTNSAALFNGPAAVAVDSAGNVYVADTSNDTIRKVAPVGTNWVVTTLAGLAGSAGSANGTGNAARFYFPFGLTVDTNGNVYVADSANDTIRKVTSAGVVTTLAGLAGNIGSANGTGSAARFYYPYDVTVDTNGNVYVADSGNNTIRKMTPAGVVTTLAGLAGSDGTNNGTGSAARFYFPNGATVDSAGNVYVADTGNNTIRKVTPTGVVTTLAGLEWNAGSTDGTGNAALFYWPDGIAVDSAGNVYVADGGNNTIRKVTPTGANWVVTTLAGLAGHPGNADGTNSAARFNGASFMTVDSAGNLYVAVEHDDTIRKVTPVGTNWVVTTLAGLAGNPGSANGTNSAARFNWPASVAVDSAGNLYVADFNNNTIRKVTPVGTNWVVTTLAGLAGNHGSADGTNSAARFYYPNAAVVDTNGNVYVADSGNNTIREVTPVGTNWVVTTLAGLAGSAGSADGTNSAARFSWPACLAVDSAGNVYVSDALNDTMRQVTPVGTNWVVTTLAGLAGYIAEIDGTGSAARFNGQAGVAVDSAGNLYVADWGNFTIREGFPASSVSAPMLQPPNLSAGQFGFGITGLPDLAVNIEASGDLSQWEVVGTCLLGGGTNFFVNPNPALGAQFYRVHVR